MSQERESLSSFNVHPQYQEIQKEANLITKNIHDLSNNNLMLNRKLERYEDSIKSEKAPEVAAVEKLYAEVGIHFADRLKKTLEEAKNFHSTVIKNRKHFLEAEVSGIKNEISSNEKEIAQKESLGASYVSKIFNLNFLSPKIVARILSGTQPRALKLQDIVIKEMPDLWDEQEKQWGF